MANTEKEKVVIKLNASSLRYTTCLLNWHRIVVEGWKQKANAASSVYGVGVHKFMDTMYKTDRLDLARDAALVEFRKPKYENNKSRWLSDEGHFLPTCFTLWQDHVSKDKDYSLVMLEQPCWWCDGSGKTIKVTGSDPGSFQIDNPKCEHCNGTGKQSLPASEVTFSIKIYEDEFIIVYLEGTIDGIGKILNGCYAIRDFKTTSSYDEEYLDDYEMSNQLRFYLLALKIMARLHPDSVLGQIGSSRVGVFIDGIFLKSKVFNNEYKRSIVFQFTDHDMAQFELGINRLILKISDAIRTESWKHKEGLVNGSCKPGFRKCDFWYVCRSDNEAISAQLLRDNFNQKTYNPFKHNE